MVQSKKAGRFEAPAPLPARVRAVNWGAIPKQLAPSTSAKIQPITTPEREILSFLALLAAPILSNTLLNTYISEVKGYLFEKKYELAFGGQEEYRQAYAARWVPSRALIYRKIMKESPEIKALLCAGCETGVRNVICIGGGAGSEVVALGSLISKWTTITEGSSIKVIAVDSCDWSDVIRRQERGMVQEWLTLEGRFSVDFIQANCLDVSASNAAPSSDSNSPSHTPAMLSPVSIDYSSASLITILFTISELLIQSRPATVAMLNHLSTTTISGTLLLIVESASLSDIPMGSSGRTYPLGTLLDHTFCEDRSRDSMAKWEKIREEDSTWYRMPEDAAACYPLRLENTRVCIRLFRRI